MHKDKHYSIALQCARLSSQGCSLGCEQCQYNVFNYVDDAREASLLKANAYTDFYNSRQREAKINSEIARDNISVLVVIGLFILVSMWGCSYVRSCVSCAPSSAVAIEEIVPVPMASPPNHWTDPDVSYLINNPNQVNNIPRVFRIMKRYGVPDFTGKGMSDQLNYVMWFRLLYGSDARIIRNPDVGFFIRVDYQPFPNYVDISATIGNEHKYTMGSIWGIYYKPFFNTDVTEQYGHVTRDMWR